MPNEKAKHRRHAKMYYLNEEEEKSFKDHAKKKGFSLSTWLRILALKDVKRYKRIVGKEGEE